MTKPIRWGILSTARIGTQKVIPAMQNSEYGQVTAIASRRLDAAQRAASDLGITKAYDSYEKLLADPEIDAIYNPLPNHLHVPWSIKALEAGKHVLCEKPIGRSSREGEHLLASAERYPHLKIMEAFMYRHHPQWRKAQQLVDDEVIGTLRTIQTLFSYYNDNPDDIRNRAELGGGGLMDIGCYPISLSRFLFRCEPRRVMGWMEYDAQFGTDRMTSAVMDFGSGTSTFTCSTQLTPYQRVHILGDSGRIEIEIPFNAPPDRPCRLWLERNQEREEIEFPICDQYTIQGDLFAQAILNDTPVPTPLTDAIANMRTIEAIIASARDGSWARVVE
jgi:predicted dehydrogenase